MDIAGEMLNRGGKLPDSVGEWGTATFGWLRSSDGRPDPRGRCTTLRGEFSAENGMPCVRIGEFGDGSGGRAPSGGDCVRLIADTWRQPAEFGIGGANERSPCRIGRHGSRSAHACPRSAVTRGRLRDLAADFRHGAADIQSSRQEWHTARRTASRAEDVTWCSADGRAELATSRVRRAAKGSSWQTSALPVKAAESCRRLRNVRGRRPHEKKE